MSHAAGDRMGLSSDRPSGVCARMEPIRFCMPGLDGWPAERRAGRSFRQPAEFHSFRRVLGSLSRKIPSFEEGSTVARLAWQGQVPANANACWVPPTIFTDVPATSSLFREEIFGPVLSLTKAKTFDEALALANETARSR